MRFHAPIEVHTLGIFGFGSTMARLNFCSTCGGEVEANSPNRNGASFLLHHYRDEHPELAKQMMWCAADQKHTNEDSKPVLVLLDVTKSGYCPEHRADQSRRVIVS